ncbi:MAG: choice-of-anchor X domain-containing protein [Phycisphaerales bacterium]
MNALPLAMRTLAGAASLLALTGGAVAQMTFPEAENNNSKANANLINGMAPADMITGFTTGSSTVGTGNTTIDYFRVKTAAAPLGIYRYRLTLTTTGVIAFSSSIRGLNQSARVILPTTDPIFQSSNPSTTPPRSNQWYGFGKQEEIYYSVIGTNAATANYVSTLDRQGVIPGSFPNSLQAGPVTIARSAGVTTDTDFWVYDANLNAIATFGNDDPETMTRNFSPGTYFLAISNFNTANNQPAPSDDTSTNAVVLDFPNVFACSSVTPNVNVGITVTHGGGSFNVPGTKVGAYDVLWYTFTVEGSPSDPTGTGVATPEAAPNDGTGVVALAVSVIPGGGPTSTGLAVNANASAIGRSSGLMLNDDGLAPDAAAGDNIFTANVAVNAGTLPGNYALPFSITDDQGRSGAGNIALRVFTSVANDLCENPTPISGLLSVPWSNLDATGNGIGYGPCNAAFQDVFFLYTVPATGRLTIDTITSDGPGVVADTVLAGFMSCASLPFACDDDGGGSGKSRIAALPVVAGQQIVLAVGSFDTERGSGVLNFGLAPFTGGCCFGSSGCSVQTEADCFLMGGAYLGNDVPCGLPDAYSVASSPVPLEDISVTGTAVTLTDDSSVNVALPFTFPFWGMAKNNLNICSNGFLSFGNLGLNTLLNTALPNAAAPNDAIYGLWDDLNPGVGGSVRHETRGIAPARRFIVQFTNVPQFAQADSNTFQIVLFEDGHIALRYGTITAESPAGDYTIGVENALGTLARSISPGSIGTGSTSRILTFVPAMSLCPGSCIASAPAYPTGGPIGGPMLISVRVPDLCLPAVATVRADLSPIGGPMAFDLFDDRTHGDPVAGDGIYSAAFVLSPLLSPGTVTLNHTVTESGGNTSDTAGEYELRGPPACSTTLLNNIAPGMLSPGIFPPELESQIERCDGCEASPGPPVKSTAMVDDLELDGLEGIVGNTIECVEAVMRADPPGSPIGYRVNLHNTLGSAQTNPIGNQYREEFLQPTQIIQNFDNANYPGFDLVRFSLGTGFQQQGSRMNLPMGTYYLSVVAISNIDDGPVVVALSNAPQGNFNAFGVRFLPPPTTITNPPPSNAAYRVKGTGPVPDCSVDFNGDGFNSPDDLDTFITFFFSDDPGENALCDFNNDGFVEPGDLDEFITAYFEGC